MLLEVLDEQISYYENDFKHIHTLLDNIIETSEVALNNKPNSRQLKLAIKQLEEARKFLN